MENSEKLPINLDMIASSDNGWWQVYDERRGNICVRMCYADQDRNQGAREGTGERNQLQATEFTKEDGIKGEKITSKLSASDEEDK